MKKYAVCAIIEREGLFLAVSRRNEPDQWGFPGGKVEDGESVISAIQRELSEETGLAPLSIPLYPFHFEKDGDCYVLAYTSIGDIGDKGSNVVPESDEFKVAWVDKALLCDHKSSPFAEYNLAAFKTRCAFLSTQLAGDFHGQDVSSDQPQR